MASSQQRLCTATNHRLPRNAVVSTAAAAQQRACLLAGHGDVCMCVIPGLYVCGIGAAFVCVQQALDYVLGTKTLEKLVHSLVPTKHCFTRVLQKKCRQIFGDILHTQTKCKSARDAADGVILPRGVTGRDRARWLSAAQKTEKVSMRQLRPSIFFFFFR